MTETVVTHHAAIADFGEGGVLIVKTTNFEKFVFRLGAAQIINLKRALDSYSASLEVSENANKGNVAR